MATLTNKIKAELRKLKVKNSVSTYNGTVTVTIKSPVSQEILDAVKALETVEAHGCVYDDTRYYTGKSIQFNYNFEATAEEIAKADELYNSWSEDTRNDRRIFNYHFRKQLLEELGPVGHVILERVYKIY